MNGKPTFEELEFQIAELKKQNEILRSNFVLHNKLNEERTTELIQVKRKNRGK